MAAEWRSGIHWLGIAFLAGALGAYITANLRMESFPRAASEPEFSVRLPIPAQVLMAAGDRHLAADLAGFRVLVADTARMGPQDYALQAGLQRDIAFLNPAHEDNYYIAAAILPWGGQLEAAQFVLKRAADARRMDFQPLFYYGFNLFHFYRKPGEGAAALVAAADRAADLQDQMGLRSTAALWLERGYTVGEAATRVEAMANAAPPGSFRKYLRARAERLRALAQLRVLARSYKDRFGKHPRDLGDLVRSGLVDGIPRDPLGVGYAIDDTGEPVFADAVRKVSK